MELQIVPQMVKIAQVGLLADILHQDKYHVWFDVFSKKSETILKTMKTGQTLFNLESNSVTFYSGKKTTDNTSQVCGFDTCPQSFSCASLHDPSRSYFRYFDQQ